MRKSTSEDRGERWLEEAPGPWRRRSGARPALRAASAPVTSEEAAARSAVRS